MASSFVFFAASLLVVPCQSLALARIPDIPNEVCDLRSVSGSVSFALGDDVALTGSNISVAKEDPSLAEKRVKLDNAIKEYKKEADEAQVAQSKMMAVMESMLEVPSVDGPTLTKLTTDGGQDTLVVFYAPWCPHCQTFVLHDKQGDPYKAPLELLRKDWAADTAMSHVSVVRFDVQASGGPNREAIPEVFPITGIPRAFFVNTKGRATQFSGNAHDVGALKAFVASKMS